MKQSSIFSVVALCLLSSAPALAQHEIVVKLDTIGSQRLGVSAAANGTIHIVVDDGNERVETVAMSACAIPWSAIVDSTAAWPVHVNTGEIARFAGLLLAPARVPHISYVRMVFAGDSSLNRLSAQNPDRLPVMVQLTNRQVATFTASIRRASAIADSLSRGSVATLCGSRYAARPPAIVPAAGFARTGPVYFEYQTDRQAKPKPGNPVPEYPPMLRAARVEGEVVAFFTVSATGEPEPESLQILKSTHDLFTNAVKQILPSLHYTPALVSGVPVRQHVQVTFPFKLAP